MLFENLIKGAITTEPEQVVIHSRQQIQKWRDETECPVKAGRKPNRKMASSLFQEYLCPYYEPGLMLRYSIGRF